MPARCFLAIGLTPPIRGALREARLAFLDQAPDWAGEKWVSPDLLHVTLKFIGPLPDEAVPEALESLAATARRLGDSTGMPALRLQTVRATPSARRTTMLWATFADDEGRTGRLHSAVDDVLAGSFGVPRDERAYSPHVTMLRTRRPRRCDETGLAAAQARLETVPASDRSMSVLSFTLLASTLGPGGPTYETVGEVPLA